MLGNGVSWDLIMPLRMPSLLPHDLCHGQSSSHWPPAQNFPQFIVIRTIKGFGIVNKAEIDVFLELSCFFHDPPDVRNLISGSFAFSKTSLNVWKFMGHVLLKPGLENCEHDFTSVQDECKCAVVWAFFSISFLWDLNENRPFPVLWPLLSFPNCWHIECSTFTASSFRIWNSSTRILSPPLAYYVISELLLKIKQTLSLIEPLFI